MSLYQKYRPTTFEQVYGNDETVASLESIIHKDGCPHSFLFTGPTGCVDKDTEFLSPTGWKKISQWDGEKVMQYNEDGTGQFVYPFQFIKRPATYVYHIKTKYGVDQCLSLDHRFIYFNKKNKNKIYEQPFGDIIKQHKKSKRGFTGLIKTTFVPLINTDIKLNEFELRVQVMFNADGSIVKNRKKCCVNLKKKRKIERAEYLLSQAHIQFDKTIMKNGYVRFYFIPPLRNKSFDSSYFKASTKQLEIITDEVFNWDAEYGKLKVITTDKPTKDFLQYAFASVGLRSSVYLDNRKEKTTYVISCTKRNYVSIVRDNKVQPVKTQTKDGFEYSFTVPSSYLILRRNDRIFITGNCGKTTLGRIVAKELGAADQEIIEIDSGQFRGIDTIRDIRKQSQYTPIGSDIRVWIVDEVHQLSKDAQNAFLKILEDTPDHVYFILCTTEPQKLIPTIKGRCSEYLVSTLTDSEIFKLLRHVVHSEQQKLKKPVYEQIIADSFGHPRNAIQILEKVLASPEEQRLEAAKQAAAQQSQSIELCRAIVGGHGWKAVSKILKQLKDEDPEGIRRHVLAYLQTVLLTGENDTAAAIMEEFIEPFYGSGFPGLVYACYSSVNG